MTSFKVESWIWYGVVMSMVIARFVARIMHFKSIWRLQPEDWLMLFLSCLYTILIVFLNIDETVSTNLIDPAHPVDLTPHEIQVRTWGSKTVLLVEQCMCAVQWGTKLCLLLLYWRLTQNLRQNLVVKLAAVYVGATYIIMEILYFGVWCRPFHDYWQTPTDNVQCTTALHHLELNLAFNLTSDILIMSIPLPLLVRAHLEIKRKILLVFPFSLGLFTILCAILSKHLSFTQPFSAEWVFWYCRESSTAMIVTNMPYSWALIRRIFKLKSFFGDSTADEMQGGEARELNGVSLGGTRPESRTGLRPASVTEFEPRKKSWLSAKVEKLRNPSSSEENGLGQPGSWQSESAMKRKESAIEAGIESSTCSSAGSVARQPAQSTTAAALDKLYRLDDEDLEAPHLETKRYDG